MSLDAAADADDGFTGRYSRLLSPQLADLTSVRHGPRVLDVDLQKLLTENAVPADLRIPHADKTERILSLADMLAGARSDFLCRADMAAHLLIARRIQGIESLVEKRP